MFKSINFTQVRCTKCGEKTKIHPGKEFKGLNCTCKTEKSKQFSEIVEYKNKEGKVVELLGQFKNKDLEVKYVDGSQSYRIPKATFEDEFFLALPDDESTDESTDESEPKPLTKESLKGKTKEQVRAEFKDAELRALGKELKIKAYHNVRINKLIIQLVDKCK